MFIHVVIVIFDFKVCDHTKKDNLLKMLNNIISYNMI